MKTKLLSTIINFADKNSNVILTTGTALGVVGTGILSGLGAIKYTNLVDAKENRTKKPLNKKEKFGIAAKTLWPAVAVGTVTIVLTVSNCKITSKKTAALAAAYTIANDNFIGIKNKLTEVVGEKKAAEVVKKVAADKVNKNPQSQTNTANNMIFGSNDASTKFYDELSGRYFYSTIDKVNRAVNTINRNLMDDCYVSLNDFYAELDNVPPITLGEELGWNVNYDGTVSPIFTPIIDDNNQPVVVLSFDIRPRNFDWE